MALTGHNDPEVESIPLNFDPFACRATASSGDERRPDGPQRRGVRRAGQCVCVRRGPARCRAHHGVPTDRAASSLTLAGYPAAVLMLTNILLPMAMFTVYFVAVSIALVRRSAAPVASRTARDVAPSLAV